MDSAYKILTETDFRLYSSEEILQLSVKEIVNPQTFDILQSATSGGLHDPALGPADRDDICDSCGQSEKNCPGHFGHIKLPVLVFNPLVFKALAKLLSGTCLACHRINIQSNLLRVHQYHLNLLRKGLFIEAEDLLNWLYNNKSCKVEDVDNYVKTLNDTYTKTDASPYTKVIVKEAVEYILKLFSRAPLVCIHCKEQNRALTAENNQTIIGTFSRQRVAKSNTPSKEKNEEEENQAGQEEEEAEEEVEMDTAASSPTNMEAEESTRLDGIVVEMQTEFAQFLKSPQKRCILSPYLIQKHLKMLWDFEADVLKAVFPFLATVSGGIPTDIFFLDVIPVPPTRFRPLSVMKEMKFENQQTINLSKILIECKTMEEYLALYTKLSKGMETDDVEGLNLPASETSIPLLMEKIMRSWLRLQTCVNVVLDKDLDKQKKTETNGIKQVLEKKEGLLRMHMMGKRVNFAARSVISPDPYIATNEIGVPIVFASKLTYPERVTPWNVHVLRQMVINGPANYPGAFSVINDDGFVVRLSPNDVTQREAIAKQLLVPDKEMTDSKIVCRHLVNGDFLLLNRQPTLHRPSIQAHKARVLPSNKTLKLHYSSCKSYNADFDGDEMNAHLPQCELGRAEASILARTDYQYLVPKDGSPLGGLIQDHMVSGVTLTLRGRFFNRQDYCGLVWKAMNNWTEKLKLVPPCIIKPYPLWSGKQIISTILLNIIPNGKVPLNLTSRAKIPEKSWIDPNFINHPSMTPFNLAAWDTNEMGESKVVFRNGELLQGVLDKAHYGPSTYGLVHSCYELYGGIVAGQLLTYLGRLFTNFLQMVGFSLGVGDILVQRKADKKRRRFIKNSHHIGKRAVMKALRVENEEEVRESELLTNLKRAHLGDQNKIAEVDMFMKRETDQIQDAIAKTIMPKGLQKEFPNNSLQLMVQSGAKGSPVNCMQISCLLGQIELEGRRPPLMISGKSLPSFLPYDVSPQAGGFVSGRFLTGICPQEYFFHCMAGREGLIDTAVKTSRSGYLQRCLVKHLEDIMVNYDFTVRDTSGSVLQFYYGEDGLDPLQASYLNSSQFPFLTENFQNVFQKESPWTSDSTGKEVKKMWKKISKARARTVDKGAWMDRDSGFLSFCKSDEAPEVKDEHQERGKKGKTRGSEILCEAWFNLDEEERRRYSQKWKCPDPVMSQYLPHSQVDVLPEKLRHSINVYCKKGFPKVVKQIPHSENLYRDVFKEAINRKAVRSMANAGDPVGLLCAQSIGEPSTQMTLNTFHFAGRGEMNVTLGIPRLREILMTGGMSMKTPSMDVHVRPGAEAMAERIRRHFNKVTLDQVLESVKLKITSNYTAKENHRVIDAKFKFLHRSHIAEITNVDPMFLMKFIAKRFLPLFDKEIKKSTLILEKSGFVSSGRVKRLNVEKEAEAEIPVESTNPDDDENEFANLDPKENDASTQKEFQRQQDTQEYEGEDEERNEVMEDDNDESSYSSDEESDGKEEPRRPATPQEEKVERVKESSSHNKSRRAGREKEEILKRALAYSFMCDFSFDEKKMRWFQFKIKYPPDHLEFDVKMMLEKLVKRTVVHQVRGITRAILVEEDEGGESVLHLKTEGINIEALTMHPQVLDLNRIYTNNIHTTASIYGIEAANRVLIKEVQNVFGAYGITVDYHHLSLLADYLTSQGVYNAFNRRSINFKTSPLQKMTFETTVNFLLDALISGDKDNLDSPSSCLVVGKPIRIGTGCFDVMASA